VWSDTRFVFVGTLWDGHLLKEAKVYLAHFYTVTTVTKPDRRGTDTFSRFWVLKAS